MSTGIRISDKDALAGFDYVFALHNGSTGPLSSTALATALAASGAVADAIAATASVADLTALDDELTAAIDALDIRVTTNETDKADTSVTDALDTRLDAVEAAQTSGGIDRDPVAAWAGSNITLSGTQTVDGVTLSNGDRVGVGGQSDASENGVYAYNDSGAWTRVTDMDASGEIPLSTVFVTGGATYGGYSYRFSVADAGTFTLDTDAITATQVGDGGALQDQIDAIDTRVETL
ncbi:hypothetical protein, partial [Mameliella alba]